MLLCSSQVTESQQKDLAELSDHCVKVDKGLPALYQHLLKLKRTSDNNVFYYQDERLLGFLSVYFFYEDACEVSLLVDPAYRKQGIATALLEAILPLLEAKGMVTLIFSAPGSLHNAWFTSLGFAYRQSEYHMERESFMPILINNPALVLRKATLRDVGILCAIDIASFTGQQSLPERFFNLLNDNEYTLFLAYKNDQVVGKAHIRWQAESALLSDIAILPPFQRRGFGAELLSHCINHAMAQGKIKITLDVEATNNKALNLYARHGFKTTKVFDFWNASLLELKEKLLAKRG